MLTVFPHNYDFWAFKCRRRFANSYMIMILSEDTGDPGKLEIWLWKSLHSSLHWIKQIWEWDTLIVPRPYTLNTFSLLSFLCRQKYWGLIWKHVFYYHSGFEDRSKNLHWKRTEVTEVYKLFLLQWNNMIDNLLQLIQLTPATLNISKQISERRFILAEWA